MKKFLAMMLAVLMLLSMATVAFADGEKAITPSTFDVKLSVVGSGIPSANYMFTFKAADTTPAGYETAVETNQLKILSSIGVGNEQKVTFDMPSFVKPGNYLYKVTMSHHEIRGATDNYNELYVIMCVVNDTNGLKVTNITMYDPNGTKENKIDAFVTTYKTARLTINKKVNDAALAAAKGNKYEFAYTIYNLNDSETYNYTVAGETETATASPEGVIRGTAKIADDESIIFTNLPVGATYTVTETETYNDGNGTFVGHWDKEEGEEVVPTSKTLGENGATHTMTNTFTYKNELRIEKKVTGDGGYMEETFPVKVTFTGDLLEEGHSYNVVVVTKWADGAETTSDLIPFVVNEDKVYTFNIQNNQIVKIKDLPQNVHYKVEETDSKGHTPKYTNEENTLTNADMDVVIENNNRITPETGVSLDTLPYVLVLALAGAGLVLMIARKRRVQD